MRWTFRGAEGILFFIFRQDKPPFPSEGGMNQQQYKMMKVLQKVTIFKGFDVSEAEHLLQRCFLQTYEVGQEIYRADEASEEMLILLNG